MLEQAFSKWTLNRLATIDSSEQPSMMGVPELEAQTLLFHVFQNDL